MACINVHQLQFSVKELLSTNFAVSEGCPGSLSRWLQGHSSSWSLSPAWQCCHAMSWVSHNILSFAKSFHVQSSLCTCVTCSFRLPARTAPQYMRALSATSNTSAIWQRLFACAMLLSPRVSLTSTAMFVQISELPQVAPADYMLSTTLCTQVCSDSATNSSSARR